MLLIDDFHLDVYRRRKFRFVGKFSGKREVKILFASHCTPLLQMYYAKPPRPPVYPGALEKVE